MAAARKGANDIGRMLGSKQLHTNVSKSKYVIVGTEKSRTECLKEAELIPILMEEHVLDNSASEKYMGDRIK